MSRRLTVVGRQPRDLPLSLGGSYDQEQWYVNEGGHPALQFDGSGNLTVRYFGGSQEQVTSMTAGGQVYWMAADNEGSVRDVVDNLAGDLTSQSATIAGTGDFINSYSYNADQQLTVVTQQGQSGGNVVSPKEIDYAYNSIGQPTSAVDYNTLSGPRTDVLTGTYGYDGDSRLTSLDYTSDAGATTIDSLGFTYNAASLVTSFSSIDGTASYGYDPTNQVTAASYTTASGGHQPANENFSFDSNGNRNSTGYATGDDNLMSSDGTYDYTHDADGNVTSRTQIASTYSTQYLTTYTWDYRNRLTDVEYYDNSDVLTGHVHFVYDVFDDLIETEVDTTGDGTYNEIEHYVLDVSPQIPAAGVPGTTVSQPVLDFDGDENLIQRDLVAPSPAGVDAVMVQGAVTSTSEDDSDTWAADDDLGTPHDILSSSGRVDNHIVDCVFGEIAYQSDPSVTWWAGFAGGHLDTNTGLVNDYHRWYDAATGRWLSEDPESFAAGDSNLERYLGNSPTGGLDNTGLFQAPSDDENGPPVIIVHPVPIPGVYPGGSAIPANSPFYSGGIDPPPPYASYPFYSPSGVTIVSPNPAMTAGGTPNLTVNVPVPAGMTAAEWQQAQQMAQWLNQVNAPQNMGPLNWPQPQQSSIFGQPFWQNWPLTINPHGHIGPQISVSVPGMPLWTGIIQVHFGTVGPTPQHPYPGFQGVITGTISPP